MGKQYCTAEQAHAPELIPALAVLCLVGAAMLTPAGVLYATGSQPQRPQFQNIEPTQTLGQSQRVKPGEVPRGLSKGEWANIRKQITAGHYRAHKRENDSGAKYSVTIDSDIQQQAYIKASNTDGGDLFGWSVASSGNTVVIGADREDSNATGINGNQSDNSAISAGAVYVFMRNGIHWSQQAYLKASNSGSGDRFGLSIAISGDTLVVGAAFEDSNATGVNGSQSDNSANSAGAAYVFTRSGTTWSQQAYLKASNNEIFNQFGFSVAISGDTVVVGADLEDSNATGVNGDENDNSAENAGAAYVFIRNGEQWSQQAYLKSSNSGGGDLFGISVAISSDTVVVGAIGEDSNATGVNGDENDNSAEDAGAAYVFTRTGTQWSQQAYLKASNNDIFDQFGFSVAISGDTVVVGADLEDSNATGINGDQSDNSAISAGAAYVFTRSGRVWSQESYLKASNTEAGDDFGASLAIFGDTLVVGAYPEDSNATGINGDQGDNSAISAGAAYVFTRSGTVWTQQAYLKASNTDAVDGFGHSVTISDDTVVVGVLFDDSNATGINGDQNDNSAEDAGAAFVFNPSPDFTINAGHSGTWFNPETSGQGLLIDVAPEDQFMFISWFTFTAAASNNPDEQQWYTAQGNYSGSTAELILYETLGGQFDAPQEVSINPVGEVTLSFTDCVQGQMVYRIDTDGRRGTIPLQRLIPGSDNVCEQQSGKAANTAEAVDINAGMDGAWVNTDTLGQGFFIDAHTTPAGGNFIFVAWFTYGDDTASGQRWLTAQGDFAGSVAAIDVWETTGGRFDDPQAVNPEKVGTMNLDFTDCSNAQLSYSLTDEDLAGDMELSRLIPGGQALCEELAGAD